MADVVPVHSLHCSALLVGRTTRTKDSCKYYNIEPNLPLGKYELIARASYFDVPVKGFGFDQLIQREVLISRKIT